MTTETIGTTTIGTGELAKLLDVTPQRIGQLVQAGVLRKLGRGRYRIGEAVPAYVRFLRDQPAGGGGPIDYREMRSRLVKLQGDALEIDLAKARAESVSIADVATVFGEQCSIIRAKFIGLASRVAPRLAGQDVPSAHAIISKETSAILRELTCDADAALKAEQAGAVHQVADGEEKPK